mmetsp:Transcript_8358/g.9982  ORF Transcript_8358/g.9982 Transcript_8358/m.9982 type:complete len:513 (+) Transcript_8358:68-1606(+)
MTPYSKIFKEMNATPTYFMREITPIDTRLLPPLMPFYDEKPCPKSNPTFTTVSMASFSKENLEGFPIEMLPGKGERLRTQTNQFTNSFIAGAYRDNRMGVAELRKKRIQRLKLKQEKLSIAQKKLSDEVDRIHKRGALRLIRDIERTRRLHDLHSITSAVIIQRYIRRWKTRREMDKIRIQRKAEEAQRQREKLARDRYKAASIIARATLKHLAYKYSRLSRLEVDSQTTEAESRDDYYEHIDEDTGESEESGDDDADDGAGEGGGGKRSSFKELSQRLGSHRSFNEGSSNRQRRASVKNKANTFLDSLLSRQDSDGQMVTHVMKKLVNESPKVRKSLSRRLSDQTEPTQSDDAVNVEAEQQSSAAGIIQRNIRGYQHRELSYHRKLLRKTFKAWRSYRKPRSRPISPKTGSFGEIQRPRSAASGRPTLPTDAFSTSILELLKFQHQEDLELSSAIAIQSFWRKHKAKKFTNHLKTMMRMRIKKQRESTAKSILARIPHVRKSLYIFFKRGR